MDPFDFFLKRLRKIQMHSGCGRKNCLQVGWCHKSHVKSPQKCRTVVVCSLYLQLVVTKETGTVAHSFKMSSVSWKYCRNSLSCLNITSTVIPPQWLKQPTWGCPICKYIIATMVKMLLCCLAGLFWVFWNLPDDIYGLQPLSLRPLMHKVSNFTFLICPSCDHYLYVELQLNALVQCFTVCIDFSHVVFVIFNLNK